MERLQAMQAKAEETLHRYEQLREDAGLLSTEGTSDDGSVRVVVNEQREVTKVEISDRAMAQRAGLSRMIITAINRAHADHARKLARLTEAMTGDSMGVAERVEASIPDGIKEALERKDRRDR
jgi:DNA-binding protein YbaB